MNSSAATSLEILILARDFPPRIGGRASIFRDYARHLPGEHTCISTPWAWRGSAVDRTMRATIDRAWTFGDTSQGLGYRLWSRHLAKLCQSRRPQLVLAAGLVPEGLLALEMKKQWGIPYLLHLEAPQIVTLREGNTGREVSDGTLREIVAASNGILVGSQACWFEAYRLGIYPHDLQKVPVGIDLDRFRPGEKPVQLLRKWNIQGGPVLLTVMGQAPVDEVETLLRAFTTVRQSNKDAVLLIVGKNPEEVIRKLARELGVESAIRLIRSVAEMEMPDLYRTADLFVMAGRENREQGQVDGIQLSALEALASGIPIVGARTRTTEELIPEGDAGELVDPGSPAKLARAILEGLRTRGRDAEGKNAARALAEKEWDAAHAAARLRETLEVVYYRRLRVDKLPRPHEFAYESAAL